MRNLKGHKSRRDRGDCRGDSGDHREPHHAVPEQKDRGRLHGKEEPGEDRNAGAVVRNGREQGNL